MIRLSQEFGAHTGRQLTFELDRVRVGRAPDNDVVFDPNADLDASGHHCEIVREQGAYVVADLNSRNGTFVNGTRVVRQPLQPGDVIECGRGGPRLRVLSAGGVAATSAQPLAPGSFAASPGPTTPPLGGYGPPPNTVPPPAAAFAPAPTPAPFGGGFAPVATPPPAMGAGPAPFAPAPPYAVPPAAALPAAGPGSVGAAFAAQMPAGAQIGKRTVAMMIDAALAQSGAKKSNTGLKVLVALTLVLVLAGLGVGGYLLTQDRDEVASVVGGSGGGGDSMAAGERITAQAEGAIYLLASVRAGTNPQGFCSGFAVTQDLIATNAHCVEVARDALAHGGTILALQNNGRGAQIPVQPVYQDPRFHNPAAGLQGSGFDVGLVRAGAPLPITVRLASVDESQRVRPGAPIFVYGFPGMTMNEASPVATITEGVLNRSTDFFDRAADPPLAQKVQHTAQTTSGSSGSPIFLANGSVIGINAGSLADEERQSMLDPRSGQRVNVEVNRSSNFKYGMRADLIRLAVQTVGEAAP